jgi:hypothetical protein
MARHTSNCPQACPAPSIAPIREFTSTASRLAWGLHFFFESTALKPTMSRACSATSRFSLRFSSSSCGRRCASLTSRRRTWPSSVRTCRQVCKILHEGIRYIEKGIEPELKILIDRARSLAKQLRKFGYNIQITPAGSIWMQALLGNGNGAFTQAPGSPFKVASPPYNDAATPLNGSIVAGDFNHSGHEGLAVVDQPNAAAYILRGNGNGTFSPSSAVFAFSPAAGKWRRDVHRGVRFVVQGRQRTLCQIDGCSRLEARSVHLQRQSGAARRNGSRCQRLVQEGHWIRRWGAGWIDLNAEEPVVSQLIFRIDGGRFKIPGSCRSRRSGKHAAARIQ